MQVLPELWMDIVAIIVLSILLSLIAYKFNLLTKSGCVAAAVMGLAIGFFGSLSWLILLIVFTFIGFIATLFGLSKKREKGLQEGKHGERTYKNVLGVAIPCIVIAVANLVTNNEHYHLMMIGYIAAIAVAAADTAASELGTKDENVYLITTLKRVPPGTDGGISLFGTIVSILASVAVSFVGWVVINLSLDIEMVIPMVAGVIGCMLDSVIGATLERRGLISKYGNNSLTGILGAVIAILIANFI